MRAIGRLAAAAWLTGFVLIASSAVSTASAQAPGAIVQLMPPLSDEEEDLKRGSMQSFLGQAQASAPLPEPLAGFMKQPKPTREQSQRNLLDRMVQTLERDYPAPRTIPEGKIVEAAVSVRRPDGKTSGPYRIFSSLAPGHTSWEYATGQNFAVPARMPKPAGGAFPKFDKADLNDVMFFDADGNERFIGAGLASVGADGAISMNFALVVDDKPMRIVRIAARPGASAQVSGPGGYQFTITPVLRDQKPVEQRWNALAKQQMAEGRLPSGAPQRRINPEWPGPAYVRTGPLALNFMANRKIVCSDWRYRFSNDPSVDAVKAASGPVTLTFDAAGKLQIATPSPAGAFSASAFPVGLAADQFAQTQPLPASVQHLGRSPTLADVLEFGALDQPSPFLTWERIRRDDGIIYTTKFFLRCQKPAT